MGSYFFASNSPTGNDDSNDASSSHFFKTVCLLDWWLIKAKEGFRGKTLAVGGFPLGGNPAARVFSSAPIIKRSDTFNLETADGVYVVMKGFINKTRTIENGFSLEIFNHFMFGFPPNWEECGEMYSVAEGDNEVTPKGNPIEHHYNHKIKSNLKANKFPTPPGDANQNNLKTKGLKRKGSANIFCSSKQKAKATSPASEGKISTDSTKSLNNKVSRSGRLLMRPMEFWC